MVEDLKSFTECEIVSPSGLYPRTCLNYLEPSLSGQDLGSRGQRLMGRNADSEHGAPAGTSQWQGLVTPWGEALGRVKLQTGELRPTATGGNCSGAGQEPKFPEPLLGTHCLPGEETRRQNGVTTSRHTDPRAEKEETILRMGSNISPLGTLFICAMVLLAFQTSPYCSSTGFNLKN